jgi:hypothetical protein
MPRATRRPINLLLVPLALLLLVAEDVVWAGIAALLRLLRRAPPVAALAGALGRLPGAVALPLFLIPEAVGKLGELWSLALLAQGRPVAAVEAYIGVRLVSLVVAVFIYRSCEPALMRIAWFARAVAWVHAARDWAVALVRPMLRPMRVMLRGAGGNLSRRLAALKRHFRRGRRA